MGVKKEEEGGREFGGEGVKDYNGVSKVRGREGSNGAREKEEESNHNNY